MAPNKHHRFFLLAVLFLHTASLLAQESLEKDSLKKLLSEKISPAQRIDVLNQLAFLNYDFDDSLGYQYARQAVKECESIEYPAGLQHAYTMLGIGHFSFGEYPQALDAFTKAERLNTLGELDHSIYNLILKGNILGDLGQFDSAVFQFLKAEKLMLTTKTAKSAGSINKAYARMYIGLDQYEEALNHLLKAQEVRKAQPDILKLDLFTLFPTIYSNLGEFEKATAYNIWVCDLVANREDNFHKAMCLMNATELHLDQGNFEAALRDGFKTLELAEVYKYPLLRAKLFLLMGEIYFELSDFTLASEFLYRTLTITEKLGLTPLSAKAYVALSWLYKEQGNFSQALEFADKAEILAKQFKNRRMEARCLNVRGLVYLLQKKYDLSLAEHQKSLLIREEIKNMEGVAASIFNMSLVYEELGDINKALELQLQAIGIEKEIANQQSLAISYNGLAKLYIKIGNLEEAGKYLEKTRELAQQTKSQLLLKNYYANYADLLDMQGDFKSASHTRKLLQQLSDSLMLVNNNVKLAEMQAIYQVQRKEQEIASLAKERTIQLQLMDEQEKQIQYQVLIIVLGSMAFLFALSFIFFSIRATKKIQKAKQDLAELNEELLTQSEELRESNDSLKELNAQLVEQQGQIMAQQQDLRNKNESLNKLNAEVIEQKEEIQAQAEELREANETILSINQELEGKIEERTSQLRQAYIELDTFFYRSSHDFRRPITTFMGLAEVAKITVADTKALDLFEKVNETAQSLDKMIRKLQSISDVGAQEMVYKEVLLKELIENILVSFDGELLKRGIKVVHEIKPTQPFQSYAALVRVIIENLIENSIQFASPIEPFLKILAFTQDGTLVISVEDNGQGIDKEYHDRVYDMYFRANVSSKGNGLGLYIVRKAVAKLQGTIEFTSKVHMGTRFTVILPLTA